MGKLKKDRNVYALIIAILLISLGINIIGIIFYLTSNGNSHNNYQTNFEVTSEANKATVYATLKDTDTGFVEGFGPREVALSYGHTDVSLEIKNNNKTTKSYTLVINKPDLRSSENRLSMLTTSEGKIDFKPNQFSYNINVASNINSINVNASLKSPKSHFVLGYTPRKVDLEDGLNVIFIKVKSEKGEEKDYKINVFKTTSSKEEINDNSLDLESLSLSNGKINFKKDKYEYKVDVANEIDNIDVYAFAKNKNAQVEVIGAGKINEGENEILVNVKKDNEIKTTKIIVNRQKVNQENQTKLQDLDVGGFNLEFKPDKKNYEITALESRNLIISAYPYNDNSEVTIIENNVAQDKIVQILVKAPNGEKDTYTLKIKKQFWNKRNEIIAVALTLMGGLIIVSILKYYEMKKKPKRQKRAKK